MNIVKELLKVIGKFGQETAIEIGAEQVTAFMFGNKSSATKDKLNPRDRADNDLFDDLITQAAKMAMVSKDKLLEKLTDFENQLWENADQKSKDDALELAEDLIKFDADTLSVFRKKDVAVQILILEEVAFWAQRFHRNEDRAIDGFIEFCALTPEEKINHWRRITNQPTPRLLTIWFKLKKAHDGWQERSQQQYTKSATDGYLAKARERRKKSDAEKAMRRFR